MPMRFRSKIGNRNLVGKTIAQLRKEKHIGQGDLLNRIQLQGIEMNQAKLSRIEGQKIAVIDRDLYAIAKALEVSIDDLFQRHTEDQNALQG